MGLTWPIWWRQRGFTEKTSRRHLNRHAWGLTWHIRARRRSDSGKNRPPRAHPGRARLAPPGRVRDGGVVKAPGAYARSTRLEVSQPGLHAPARCRSACRALRVGGRLQNEACRGETGTAAVRGPTCADFSSNEDDGGTMGRNHPTQTIPISSMAHMLLSTRTTHYKTNFSFAYASLKLSIVGCGLFSGVRGSRSRNWVPSLGLRDARVGARVSSPGAPAPAWASGECRTPTF